MEDLKIRVLLEDIDHKFKTIHENTVDTPKRFDKIDRDIENMKEDIAIIKVSLKLKADISRVEKIEKDLCKLQQKCA